MESILTSIKKQLGIEEDYTHFDPELIIYINSSIATLTQMGVGPVEGFTIEDDLATWTDFVGEDPRMKMVPSCIFMKVKLMFDAPQSSIVMETIKQMIAEQEWRLTHAAAEMKQEQEEASQNG